ncbi:hypothetical protein Tco_0704671 [Tanacetum coccineum]|uniref:Uncharacterized protein n=1 Tax=Tanacetum coccineum TaxID=301880 RepID=A0ABQ4Y471_9ASTR
MDVGMNKMMMKFLRDGGGDVVAVGSHGRRMNNFFHFDPHKRTLVPRVQLTTAADEEVAKRSGILDKGLKFHTLGYASKHVRESNKEVKQGTDIAKISRKRSKPDNHEHGNGRAHKEPGECYQKSTKEAQECHITDCHAGNPCELRFDLTDHNRDPIIGRNEEPGLMGSCNKLWT